MTKYSHSRLSTFEQCRYRYKLQYIDKIKIEVPQSIEAFMGDMVHQALEKLYTDVQYQKILTVSELIAFYNTVWEKNFSPEINIVKTEYSAQNYQKMGEKYLADYYNKYVPFDSEKTLGLETEYTLALRNGHSYHIRIDRLALTVDGTVIITDYKTNSSIKTQDVADEDRQLAMYAVWVKQNISQAKEIKLLWHMLAFNTPVVSSRTSEQLEQLQTHVEELINIIESNSDWSTNVSTLCNWCQYRHMCPSFKHKCELETKETIASFKADNGLQLVDKYAELKTRIATSEEELEDISLRLVQYAQSQGIDVVYGSNKKISVKEYDKAVIKNTDEFVQYLKSKGLWDTYSMICYSKVSSALKSTDFDGNILKERGYRLSVSRK